MTFYRGQEVVYVGLRFSLKRWFEEVLHPPVGEWPVKGRVYVIENITPFGSLELAGVWSPADDYWDAGFAEWAFRPARRTQTDISVFKEMLNPTITERRLDAVAHDHGFDPPKF